jgi:hypothetical protein
MDEQTDHVFLVGFRSGGYVTIALGGDADPEELDLSDLTAAQMQEAVADAKDGGMESETLYHSDTCPCKGGDGC